MVDVHFLLVTESALAGRAEAILLKPKRFQLGRFLGFPLAFPAFLEVGFPLRVVGVCLGLDFHVTLDGCVCHLSQLDTFLGSEPPAAWREVAAFYPGVGFLWMAPPGPFPTGMDDGTVYLSEGHRGDRVA